MWISKRKYDTLLMQVEHLQDRYDNLERAMRFFDSNGNHVEIKLALQAIVDHLDLKLSMRHQASMVVVAARKETANGTAK